MWSIINLQKNSCLCWYILQCFAYIWLHIHAVKWSLIADKLQTQKKIFKKWSFYHRTRTGNPSEEMTFLTQPDYRTQRGRLITVFIINTLIFFLKRFLCATKHEQAVLQKKTLRLTMNCYKTREISRRGHFQLSASFINKIQKANLLTVIAWSLLNITGFQGYKHNFSVCSIKKKKCARRKHSETLKKYALSFS